MTNTLETPITDMLPEMTETLQEDKPIELNATIRIPQYDENLQIIASPGEGAA